MCVCVFCVICVCLPANLEAIRLNRGAFLESPRALRWSSRRPPHTPHPPPPPATPPSIPFSSCHILFPLPLCLASMGATRPLRRQAPPLRGLHRARVLVRLLLLRLRVPCCLPHHACDSTAFTSHRPHPHPLLLLPLRPPHTTASSAHNHIRVHTHTHAATDLGGPAAVFWVGLLLFLLRQAPPASPPAASRTPTNAPGGSEFTRAGRHTDLSASLSRHDHLHHIRESQSVRQRRHAPHAYARSSTSVTSNAPQRYPPAGPRAAAARHHPRHRRRTSTTDNINTISRRNSIRDFAVQQPTRPHRSRRPCRTASPRCTDEPRALAHLRAFDRDRDRGGHQRRRSAQEGTHLGTSAHEQRLGQWRQQPHEAALREGNTRRYRTAGPGRRGCLGEAGTAGAAPQRHSSSRVGVGEHRRDEGRGCLR